MLDVKGCTDPKLVEEADLEAFSEGDARPEFAGHLEECLFCQNRLAEYQSLRNKLAARFRPTSASARKNCLSPQLINDYVFRLLDKSLQTKVGLHLKTCQYCQAEYQALEREASAYRVERVSEAETKLRALFRSVRAVLQPPAPQLVMRNLEARQEAIPVNPSQNPDALLEYKFEGGTVRLTKNYDRSGSQLTLTGRVKRDNYDSARLEQVQLVLRQADQFIEDKLDRRGHFNFQELSSQEELTLQIQFDDLLIIVADIQKKSV